MRGKLILIILPLLALLILGGCSNPQEESYIDQSQEAIKSVPLPTVYSEYDGTNLLTKEPEISIVYYNPDNGQPYFEATMIYYNPYTHWWDNFDFDPFNYDNGHQAVLTYKAIDTWANGEKEYYYHDTNFTLEYLQNHTSDFWWEY